MAEYIDRGTAIAKLTALEVTEPNATMADAKRVLADIPAADVAPVVHGRWIKDNDSFQTDDDYYCCYFDYNCSNCGEVVNDRYKLPKYCPECGAKMDGKEAA